MNPKNKKKQNKGKTKKINLKMTHQEMSERDKNFGP